MDIFFSYFTKIMLAISPFCLVLNSLFSLFFLFSLIFNFYKTHNLWFRYRLHNPNNFEFRVLHASITLPMLALSSMIFGFGSLAICLYSEYVNVMPLVDETLFDYNTVNDANISSPILRDNNGNYTCYGKFYGQHMTYAGRTVLIDENHHAVMNLSVMGDLIYRFLRSEYMKPLLIESLPDGETLESITYLFCNPECPEFFLYAKKYILFYDIMENIRNNLSRTLDDVSIQRTALLHEVSTSVNMEPSVKNAKFVELNSLNTKSSLLGAVNKSINPYFYGKRNLIQNDIIVSIAPIINEKFEEKSVPNYLSASKPSLFFGCIFGALFVGKVLGLV